MCVCVCVCVCEDERGFYHVVLLSAGPSKVMLGAGMKAISSLTLTECEPKKCLESLLLSTKRHSAAQLTRFHYFVQVNIVPV